MQFEAIKVVNSSGNKLRFIFIFRNVSRHLITDALKVRNQSEEEWANTQNTPPGRWGTEIACLRRVRARVLALVPALLIYCSSSTGLEEHADMTS